MKKAPAILLAGYLFSNEYALIFLISNPIFSLQFYNDHLNI